MTRFFLDTEFMEDGRTIELISIGVVSETGAEFYAESRDADLSRANPWVREHVLPYLGRWDEADDPVEPWSNDRIAGRLVTFVSEQLKLTTGSSNPKQNPLEFWGYYADYDWVVVCQLFGTMLDLPEGWPMYCRDLKQLADQVGNPKLPEQTEVEHHALADAHWNQMVYAFLHGQWQSRISDTLHDEVGYLSPREHINATNRLLRELGWP